MSNDKWVPGTPDRFLRRKYDLMVKSGVRFGGQSPWVPYFWSQALQDGFESLESVNGIEVYTFEVNDYDVSLFPELKVGQVITLHDDGDCVLEIDPEQVVGTKR